MLRYDKPHRIDELTDSRIFYVTLSNNKLFNDAKNTVKFYTGMNSYVYDNYDNHIFSYILTIYASYIYGVEAGYVKYYIAGHLYDNNKYYYKQIKCIENCMTSITPFGLTISEDNKYLICTYIGAVPDNGQNFTFRFSRNLRSSDRLINIKLDSVYSTPLEHKNFMVLPQLGDSYFYHKINNNYDTHWQILNDSNNITRSSVLASGLALIFKDPCSIRIPKRYTLWYAIASGNMARIFDINASETAAMNKDITDIVNTSKGIPDRVPMYITSVGLSKHDTTFGWNRYTVTDQTLTTYEMVFKYDTQDEFNWYYHVEFPAGEHNVVSDNWIEVRGSNNYKQNILVPSVTQRTSVATEKKLLHNLHNINNYFTSYLYN